MHSRQNGKYSSFFSLNVTFSERCFLLFCLKLQLTIPKGFFSIALITIWHIIHLFVFLPLLECYIRKFCAHYYIPVYNNGWHEIDANAYMLTELKTN